MNMYEDGILLWVGWVVMVLVLAGIVGYVDVKENEKAYYQCEETR